MSRMVVYPPPLYDTPRRIQRTPPVDPWEPFRQYHAGAWIVLDCRAPDFCRFCSLKPGRGDTVYVRRSVTWTIIHYDCARDMMAAAPKDTYDTIKARLATGGPLFDD